jgi:hypothetical protein
VFTLRHCHFGKPWENNNGKLIKIWVYHVFRQTYIPFLAAQNHSVTVRWGLHGSFVNHPNDICANKGAADSSADIRGNHGQIGQDALWTIWSDLAHVSHLEGWGVYLNQGHIDISTEATPNQFSQPDFPYWNTVIWLLGTDMRHRRESEALRLGSVVAGGEKPMP